MSTQKVVLVTGVSSGIGQATAEFLVRGGYQVFGTARSPQTRNRSRASRYCLWM
jgi:NADP-dependent 3-hydroxy acid dehydrogenase YdfG